MIDPALLVPFIVVTALTSLTPGPSMLFIMSQSVWRGPRSGVSAMIGMQAGFIVWWIMAGLGLGIVLKSWPRAFLAIALAGAGYLAWLGIQAWRHAGQHPDVGDPEQARGRTVSRHALRDGVVVALGNPKSLVYMAALLPPFIDASRPIGHQLVVLATIAMAIDVAIACGYIVAGARLARAIERPQVRLWLDRTVGTIFILIALAVVVEALSHAPAEAASPHGAMTS